MKNVTLKHKILLLTFRNCLLKMYRMHVQILDANISVRFSISFIVLLPHIRLDS